jgi:hypothetical protein
LNAPKKVHCKIGVEKLTFMDNLVSMLWFEAFSILGIIFFCVTKTIVNLFWSKQWPSNKHKNKKVWWTLSNGDKMWEKDDCHSWCVRFRVNLKKGTNQDSF